ncbi:ABC transporter permease [Streptomyces liliifuscus]|uniref:ABC transporter permease n=1 Tax=Streptomyces liliifuscus TaxID=2797636 RepID=UPI001F472E32|nr:ABC transporter permease subunit [Streptomyces liliifuscus]
MDGQRRCAGRTVFGYSPGSACGGPAAHTLLYQAGARQIPASLYEAASIDGAGRLKQFWHITLPQLRYTIVTSSTLMVVGSLTYFDLVFVLPGGGPGYATRILPLDMYITGFQSNEMGLAAPSLWCSSWQDFCSLSPFSGSPASTGCAASRQEYDVRGLPRPVHRLLGPPDTDDRGGTRPPGSSVRHQPSRCLGGVLWLVVVLVPGYWVVVTSLRTREGLFYSNPLALSTSPTLENYRLVLDSAFTHYLLNSTLVTVGAMLLTLVVSFLAAYAYAYAYAIVCGASRALRWAFSVFLLGLAIPLQATIIPVYYLIAKAQMYDTLPAIVLPSAAFAIPLTVIILVNFLRDIPDELYESMRADGAGHWRMLWSPAVPLARPALITVTIYDALNLWNGFLFPLILTQSPDKRVLPLFVWRFQGELTINIQAILAAVVLSTLPILALYILGRRQLISRLTVGFGG